MTAHTSDRGILQWCSCGEIWGGNRDQFNQMESKGTEGLETKVCYCKCHIAKGELQTRVRPIQLDLTEDEVAELLDVPPLSDIDWTRARSRLSADQLTSLQAIAARHKVVFEESEQMFDEDVVHNFRVSLKVDESKLGKIYTEKDLNPHTRKLKLEFCTKGVKTGLLRHSDSPHSSPTLLVKKT